MGSGEAMHLAVEMVRLDERAEGIGALDLGRAGVRAGVRVSMRVSMRVRVTSERGASVRFTLRRWTK